MTAPLKTVSQAYLLGISEGRAMLGRFEADGMADLATFKAELANCEAMLRQGFSGDMRQCCLGERDFWRNQVKQMEGKS
jgi:hypothetical protein